MEQYNTSQFFEKKETVTVEQKVLYYRDELNDELAPATIKSRVIDENFKYKKSFLWNACSLFLQNVLSMPIKIGRIKAISYMQTIPSHLQIHLFQVLQIIRKEIS